MAAGMNGDPSRSNGRADGDGATAMSGMSGMSGMGVGCDGRSTDECARN